MRAMRAAAFRAISFTRSSSAFPAPVIVIWISDFLGIALVCIPNGNFFLINILSLLTGVEMLILFHVYIHGIL